MKVQIFTPAEYIGTVMDLVIKRRGEQLGMEYLDPLRVMITYALPLSELIIDFHDQSEEPHARLRLDGLFVPGVSRRRSGQDGYSGE